MRDKGRLTALKALDLDVLRIVRAEEWLERLRHSRLSEVWQQGVDWSHVEDAH
jgi:hypothetical protein